MAGHPRALLVVVFMLGLTPAADGTEAKTLARTHDPVIVSTQGILHVPDRRTAAWRLYRVDAGEFVPIPFQFDPMDARGDVDVAAPAEFEFDDDDQLVFMAKDSGDRATPGARPPGSDTVLEVETTDPRDDTRGWTYLAHFPEAAPPPAAERYVEFDPTTNRARSAFYEVEYARARNYFTGLRIMPDAGGSGRNLLRQTRMLGRPTFHLLFDFTMRFTEQNSIVVLEGVRNGPVRATRRVRLSVDLGSYFPTLPTGTVSTYHYLDSYTTPSRVGIPRLVLKALREFCFENVVDFAPDAMPMRYWDGANPEGVAWSDPDVPRLATDDDHDWWVHSGDGGTMLHAFVIPPAWREWGIVRGTVFRNGAERAAGPRCAGDAVLAAGYSLLNMTKLRAAGDQQFLLTDVVLARPYAPGDEAEPMAMLRAPLRTAVRRLPAAPTTVDGWPGPPHAAPSG